MKPIPFTTSTPNKKKQKHFHNQPLMLMTSEGQIDFGKVVQAGRRILRIQLVTEQQYKNLAGL